MESPCAWSGVEAGAEAGGSGEAPGHGGGVVGQAEAAVGTEQDDAAVTAEAIEEIRDGFLGGKFGGCAVGDAVGGPLAEDQFHDGLAPAGERDGGGEIVSITTATDEGGVADAAGRLVEGASGGGGGGEVALGVEGDGADGVVAAKAGGVRVGWKGSFPPQRQRPVAGDPGFRAFVVVEDVAGEGFVGQSGGLADLGMGEALAFAVEDEFGVVDEGHAVSLGELLCAVADEVDVGTLLKDQARGLDGVAEALDAGNTAGLHAAAVHEQGIHLDAAIGGEEAAPAGIEGGVVFKDGNGGFNGIEGGTATG